MKEVEEELKNKSSLYSKLYGCDTSLNVRELKCICDELLLRIDDVIKGNV